MLTYSVYETKARLSELLALVELGMQVTITNHRRPVARLVPISEQQPEEETSAE